MSDTPGPAGDTAATPPSPAASGAAQGAAPADRAAPHPPRWAWWVAGVVVPLVGALATVLTQTQRTGNTTAPPPAQDLPAAVSSTTSGTPGTGPTAATPSPTATTTTAPGTAAPTSVPAPTRAPTRAPETTPPARQPPTRVPPPPRDGGVRPPVGVSVRIVNGNSGLCLAVPGASTAVVDLNQFACGSYADHFWRLRSAGEDGAGRARYRIVNDNSGYCAAVPGASRDTAVNVNQYPCGDYPDHFWRVEYQKRDTAGRALYRIVNVNSGLCLAVPGASTRQTAPVNQFPCGPYPDHFWRFGQG
ncbi:RICIN domain-containing protein [Streptomyces sp. E-08]|uniref:RICIN domain-containing protein n=1 Tax=Streptomyces sp. E-08 TaxID=3404047 RepID=UPI003CEDACE2